MSLIRQEDICRSQWFWHQGDIKYVQLIIYLNQVFSFDYLSKLQVNHCSSLHCKQIPVYFCHVCPRCDICAWLFPRQGLFALSRSGTPSELNSWIWLRIPWTPLLTPSVSCRFWLYSVITKVTALQIPCSCVKWLRKYWSSSLPSPPPPPWALYCLSY